VSAWPEGVSWLAALTLSLPSRLQYQQVKLTHGTAKSTRPAMLPSTCESIGCTSHGARWLRARSDSGSAREDYGALTVIPFE
jgi:hypothetical protein